LKINVDIKILLKGVFAFIAFGGILVVVGEFGAKPEITNIGVVIVIIGFVVILGSLISSFLKKKR
jgi:hypothetical protein